MPRTSCRRAFLQRFEAKLLTRVGGHTQAMQMGLHTLVELGDFFEGGVRRADGVITKLPMEGGFGGVEGDDVLDPPG